MLTGNAVRCSFVWKAIVEIGLCIILATCPITILNVQYILYFADFKLTDYTKVVLPI